MIRILWMDEELGSVALVHGKLQVDGRGLGQLVEKYRRPGMSDAELYASLPHRMTGMLWAGLDDADD